MLVARTPPSQPFTLHNLKGRTPLRQRLNWKQRCTTAVAAGGVVGIVLHVDPGNGEFQQARNWGHRKESRVAVGLCPAPQNSRLLCAGVGIDAPVDDVWKCLTDYEHLADFIPGLVVNECLQRRKTGARLKQVGQQDLYFGVQFCATAVLDIVEHLGGLPREMSFMIGYNPNNGWKDGDLFPCPELSASGAPRDIAFSLVDGDFQAFKGVWRMETTGPGSSLLSYGLHVRPQRWLPVGLIEGRIKREVQNNLLAVKRHAESNSA